jgi:hypothetical protein
MMTGILRTVLLAALAAASKPVVAAGQDTSTASLIRRIEILERATADLDRRVGALEAVIKSAPSQGQSIPASTKWQDLANWRRLREGMKMDEVRALLGEPARVEGGPITFWYWVDANAHVYAKVDFESGKVMGWTEPRQAQ